MKKTVIIVAGGLGQRFEGNTPKQFIVLNNLPILMHSILAFYSYDNEISIIVILPENQINNWKLLCEKYKFDVKHKVIKGGQTRFESVKNGIMQVNEKSLIAIHDGVRPLVSKPTIDNCFKTAEKFGNAVPVVEFVDSIREIGFTDCFPLKRANLRLVQTPQIFKSDILKQAYKKNYNSTFTDDATVLESIGEKINMIEGNRENIKITTKTDLIIAEALIATV